MRVVGVGRGESVWLAWFLVRNLKDFAPIADLHGETERAVRWREVAASVERSVEEVAWDGEWYRRAFFDDGSLLGSAWSEECQIDSIAQSWAVLSGAANAERARLAMDSVDQRLVNRKLQLVQLFTPPFDQTTRDPGYIKGYLPGIRENGGQYTHAAAWSAAAFAELGDGDKAVELFGMLCPINHTRSRADLHRYKVEPYVVPADVYSQSPHAGRGGWTWYTGAAGWLYRVGIEWILGFHKRGPALQIDPCVPRSWGHVELTYRHGSTVYRIAIENPDSVSRGVSQITLDDTVLPADGLIPLSDDGGDHRVRVVLG
jgi:cyclic beta-1,2-glucan synthetase